ncbi:hypothetical protein IV203_024643 [Nitzschia inconspicua]|uniref:Uncharacterized protein n=1 Tax=Nitzschia inconspicua TaxID=303405 RepID=A0A9K3K505_9STRA|nr:hypothetical protein IV203_024643 [Nitzschia inconspicua]
MRETVDTYNRQFSELESQQKFTIEMKEKEIERLQESLDRVEDEKMKLHSELCDTRRKHQEALHELEVAKSAQDLSRAGVAEGNNKDRHMREAVQRYTRTIADLEAKLEEETQMKSELEDRLASMRSELEDKQNQTQELIQRNTKENLKLQSDLSKLKVEKDQLQVELDLAKKDLQKKRNGRSDSVARSFTNNFSENEIIDLKKKIIELKAEKDQQARELKELQSTCDKYEKELNRSKSQLRTSERSMSRSSSRGMLEPSPLDTSQHRDLARTVADLQSQLDSARRQTDTAKLKAETLARDLDIKESELRAFEVEKIEMETKLHSLSRSKDELRSKVSDLSSRLERKEREVREVTDRYKMYVMELESKLDEDTNAKHNLQTEIDKLRSSLSSANEMSSEADELREKVYSLEKSLESYKGKAHESEMKSLENSQSLQDQLLEANKAKDAVEEALKKATAEKAEVIAALEGVINEVQNREDEIESLSELLQRRDEELQHAKIIATKALQSAKDIQKRYKDKDQGRHSDLMERMNEVSSNVDRLTSQNESLQLKIKSLERDLRDRNLECKRLKDQLRQIDGKQMRDTLKDNIPSVSTHPTYSMSHSDSMMGMRGIDADSRFDPPHSLDSESFSPSASPRRVPTTSMPFSVLTAFRSLTSNCPVATRMMSPTLAFRLFILQKAIVGLLNLRMKASNRHLDLCLAVVTRILQNLVSR